MVSTKTQYLQNKYSTNPRVKCVDCKPIVKKYNPGVIQRGKSCSRTNLLNQHPLKSAHATKSHYLFIRYGRHLPFTESSQEHIEDVQDNLRFLSRSEQIRRKQNAVLLNEYERRNVLDNVKHCVSCQDYHNVNEFMKL